MSRWTRQDLEAKGFQLPLAGPDGAAEPTLQRTNARNDGREFQRELEQTAGVYHSMRVAVFKKVDPPVRVIWIDDKANPGKKRQHVIFQQNPWLDYAGSWSARHGRALIFEAKAISKHRLKLGDGGLTDTQRTAVKSWRLAGAATCLLWKFGGRVRLFTPEMIIAAEARGDRSLLFETGLPVEHGEGQLIWDFLPVLASALWPAEIVNKDA